VLKGAVTDEVRILNPGDTNFKVGDITIRGDVEKANGALAGKKQPAEFEAHSDYFRLGRRQVHIAQANVNWMLLDTSSTIW